MALKFSYKAKDPNGQTKTGIVESSSLQQAIKTLQDNSLLVIKINEKKKFSLNNLLGRGLSVSPIQVAQFTRMLGTMLGTGLPLADSLSDLAAQTDNAVLKEVIWSILHDVQGGSSLSVAMSRFPNVFNTLYISMVRAGEVSGKVSDSLNNLADTLEAMLEFRAKVKGALTYPAVILTAIAGVATLMLTTVIPKIADVYKDLGAELPLPTRVMIALSEFITNYYYAIGIALVLFVISFKVLRKNKIADFIINNAYFKVPIFGKMAEEVELAIMMRVLGSLSASGVSILDTLNVSAGVVGNNYIREAIFQAASDIERGLPLSFSLKNTPRFPLLISQLVAIGEETGTISESLMRLSKFFQDNADRKVKTLTTALEPILILLMGAMVAGLAVAVLLPIFNLANVINQG